jgi:hypothetical protein
MPVDIKTFRYASYLSRQKQATSGRRHFYAKNGIRARESTETKLGNLDSHVVRRNTGIGVALYRQSEHNLGGHLNSVNAGDLGDEWERPCSPEIALDHLDLVVFGYELNVKGSDHIESISDLCSVLLDLTNGSWIKILRWVNESSVPECTPAFSTCSEMKCMTI